MQRTLPLAVLAFALAALCPAQDRGSKAVVPASLPATEPIRWIASWAASVQAPEPMANQPPFDPAKLTDVTIRQVIHLSAGGQALRVILSNTFGTRPLVIDAANVALPTDHVGSILTNSVHPLRFAGQPSVAIPPGAEMLSDPVRMRMDPLSDLAITFHLPAAPSVQTAHPGSHATSFLLHGNHVDEATLPGAEPVVRWFQLAEIDVSANGGGTAIAFGDSITDGHASTTDGNDRWPDVLARRLQAAGMGNIGVANEGIGGNHLLTNGIGENALERLDRDLIAVAGVKSVLVLEGINDLGALARTPEATPVDHEDLVLRIEEAYTQIVKRAHAHGIKAYGATITPDGGSDYYHPNPQDEAARLAVNAWIRQPGHFDEVVDFDALTRDPAHPDRLLPAFDSGDHLHPGPAGYKAMGDAVPLQWFR